MSPPTPTPEPGDEVVDETDDTTAVVDERPDDPTADDPSAAGQTVEFAADDLAADDLAVDDVEAAAERIETDLAGLEAERDQFLDAYRRTQADFENFRKQAQRRQSDEVGRVLGAFVERLLPVLDAGDAAIAHGAEGAREVFDALLNVLEKEGLQRVDPLGERFDPNVAEAVMHEAGDGGEQIVDEVLRVGYLWHERVLRPAMVKVKD